MIEIIGLPTMIAQGQKFPCPIMARFPTAALGDDKDAVVEGRIATVLDDRNVEHYTDSLFNGIQFSNYRTDTPDGMTFLTFYDPTFQSFPQVLENAVVGSYRLVVKVLYTPVRTSLPVQLGPEIYSQRIAIEELLPVPGQLSWYYDEQYKVAGKPMTRR